ncbi:MAG TPA: hypothetical protein VNG13_11230 [Mycobacteriales bacterium]|nr:hypothetical protein [Mycobacteriales bacterium]
MAQGSDIAIHHDAPSVYHPLHEDDIVAMVPRLLDVAGVPATVVNWGGDEPVSVEDWCAYLGELTGLRPRLVPTDQALRSVQLDLSRMHELVGHPTVPWHDGFRRMVGAIRPDLLRA